MTKKAIICLFIICCGIALTAQENTNVVETKQEGSQENNFKFYAPKAYVKSINIEHGDFFTGMTIELSNGDNKKLGYLNPKYAANDNSSFTFDKDERVTRWKIWSKISGQEEGDGIRVCGLFLQTDKDREWMVGESGNNHKSEGNGGTLLGIFGYANWEIDGIGLIFDDPLEKVILTDVEYITDSFNAIKTPTEVASIELFNDGDAMQKMTDKYSKTFTKSSNWSESLDVSLGVAVSVEAGIPTTKASLSESLSTTSNYTKGESRQESITIEDMFEINVNPKSTVQAKIMINQSKLTVDYNAQIAYVFRSGHIVNKTYSGKYHGVDFQDIKVIYK